MKLQIHGDTEVIQPNEKVLSILADIVRTNAIIEEALATPVYHVTIAKPEVHLR